MTNALAQECGIVRFNTIGDRIKYRGGYGIVNCHGCSCPPDTYHHPGSDMERCPRCGGQLITCGCCCWEDVEDEDETVKDT